MNTPIVVTMPNGDIEEYELETVEEEGQWEIRIGEIKGNYTSYRVGGMSYEIVRPLFKTHKFPEPVEDDSDIAQVDQMIASLLSWRQFLIEQENQK